MAGLRGVLVIRDDTLVVGYGDDDETALMDHDNNLRRLLQKCKETNIKLKKEKINPKTSQVRFMEHIITAKGLQVNPERVQGIQDMPIPKNKTEVQRFIGMMN